MLSFFAQLPPAWSLCLPFLLDHLLPPFDPSHLSCVLHGYSHSLPRSSLYMAASAPSALSHRSCVSACLFIKVRSITPTRPHCGLSSWLTTVFSLVLGSSVFTNLLALSKNAVCAHPLRPFFPNEAAFFPSVNSNTNCEPNCFSNHRCDRITFCHLVASTALFAVARVSS